MSVQAASLPAAAPASKRGIRLRPSRLVLNVILAAIAIFWLVPSIGLAIISLRPTAPLGNPVGGACSRHPRN